MPTSSFLIAGTHSGVGKTTLALALMSAMRCRNLRVQPFKCGPDFIDPMWHTAVCSRTSRNLDTWMLSPATIRSIYHKAAADADVCIIEGVMGLFDGRSPEDSRGSSADLAKMLKLPVILIVDAESVAASVAAVVKGFSEFDPALPMAGVICNRVAGRKHFSYLESAIHRHTKVPCLGWLPKSIHASIPERHLGLLTTMESHDLSERVPCFDSLAKELEKTVRLDHLLELCDRQESAPRSSHSPQNSAISATEVQPPSSPTIGRIAIARDAAFCFYYQDNLDLLQSAGAALIEFSPLMDSELPDNIDLLYLGGGYPEVHAARLASNASMQNSIRQYHHKGGRIYAECGGLMYCCQELVDSQGKSYPMLGLLPARTRMQKRFTALGYVEWQSCQDTLLGSSGATIRGHEFHYSQFEPLGPLSPAARLLRDGELARPDGFLAGQLLAGYAHLHFASHPQAASTLVHGFHNP